MDHTAGTPVQLDNRELKQRGRNSFKMATIKTKKPSVAKVQFRLMSIDISISSQLETHDKHLVDFLSLCHFLDICQHNPGWEHSPSCHQCQSTGPTHSL